MVVESCLLLCIHLHKYDGGILIAASQYLKGTHKKVRGGHFARECSYRTKGNDFKLKKGRFRLGVRKNFTVRVVRH